MWSYVQQVQYVPLICRSRHPTTDASMFATDVHWLLVSLSVLDRTGHCQRRAEQIKGLEESKSPGIGSCHDGQ